MPALATGAKIPFDRPVRFTVVAGLVTVSDNKSSHKTLEEGDTYTSPKVGGVVVYCIESARISVDSDYDERQITSEQVSKVDSLPRDGVEKVLTPIERPPATSDDPKAKSKAKKKPTKKADEPKGKPKSEDKPKPKSDDAKAKFDSVKESAKSKFEKAKK